LRAFLKPETTIWQYTHGVPDPTRVSPDGYSLDNFYLARPGAHEVQLDLFGDYKSNVALYPASRPISASTSRGFLAVWGKNDPFFLPRAPKRSSAISPMRSCVSSTPAISRWRPHAAEIATAIRDSSRADSTPSGRPPARKRW